MYQTEYIGRSPPVFGHGHTEDMVLARVGGPPVFGHGHTEDMQVTCILVALRVSGHTVWARFISSLKSS